MDLLYRRIAYRSAFRASLGARRFKHNSPKTSTRPEELRIRSTKEEAARHPKIKYGNTEQLRLKLRNIVEITPAFKEMSHELINNTENKHKILERIINQGNQAKDPQIETIAKLLQTLSPSVVVSNIFNYMKGRKFSIPEQERPYWLQITEVTARLSRKIMKTDAERKCAVGDATPPILVLSKLFRLCIYMRLGVLACRIMRELGFARKNGEKLASGEWKVLLNSRNIHDIVRMLSVRDPSRDREDLTRIFLVVSQYNKDFHLTDRFSYSGMEIVAILDKATPFTERTNFTAAQVELAETVIREMGVATMELIEKQVTRKYKGTSRMVCFEVLHHYLSYCYKYIGGRIFFNDGGSVYNTWCSIKPFHNRVYNADIKSPNNNELNGYYYYGILASIISFFSKNERYRPMVIQLIKELPIDSVKIAPGLMTAMVNYSIRMKNAELIQFLLSQYSEDTLGLRTKYTASQMASMLKLSLASKDFTRARKLMSFMEKNLLTCPPLEFNELIIATLKSCIKDKEQNAWDMIRQRSAKVAKYAYISFLNYMIDHDSKMDFDNTEYIFRKAVASIDTSESHFWDYWHLSYMKYIDRKYTTRQSIQVYQNCIKSAESTFKTLSDFEYKQNPFCTRMEKVRMPLSISVRPLIIRDIFKVALTRTVSQENEPKSGTGNSHLRVSRTELKEVRKWCISEFEKLGISKDSIRIDLQKSISKDSRAIGFDLDRVLMGRHKQTQVVPKKHRDTKPATIRTAYTNNLKSLKEVWNKTA